MQLKDLTKEQRHEIYKKALEFFLSYKNNKERGLCYAICDAIASLLNIEFNKNEIKHLIIDFTLAYDPLIYLPEIHKHKTDRAEIDGYFYGFHEEGINKRIEILKQAIKETE